MPTMLTIRDETTDGRRTDALTIEVLTERITVRELIRSRVYQEVQDYNLKQIGPFQGLVQPVEAERELNGSRPRKPRFIDWKAQFDAACRAFESNAVLVLVDEKQAESLEEEIVLAATSTVTFLRLVPLVGG